MAHQSLYRKYRPATFDDIVGQQHIERTLRNAVAEGTVAHAYLFTGPRGTGKTTTARILAKALLCDRGPTSEPDGTCEQCLEVANGTHPDVREIDAASNTGVDAVRDEIIGRVQFAPTRGRYKVYIIDEVHMLSNAAFNALLKTLEEPPPHVIFVLATTHPHKVPETIHSRCQRFDFHRIGVDDIADRLRFIAESEGFKVDRSAFSLIARHAEGGMRDAITTLEQLAAFTGGDVSIDDVEGLLGEVDSAQLFQVAGLVARRDIAACFHWVAEQAETGTDLAELVRELTGHVRDLYLIAAVEDVAGVVDRTADELSQLTAQAAEFGGPDRLARVLDLLGELGSEMRWSSDPRLSLEVALTRMARPQGEMTLAALAERVEGLERGVPATVFAPAGVSAPAAASGARGVATGSAGDDAPRRDSFADAATPAASAEPPAGRGDETAAPSVAAGAGPGGGLDRGSAKRNWQAVLIEIKKRKPARVQNFANVEIDVDADGKTLVIEFPTDQKFAMNQAEEPDYRDLVREALAAVFGIAPPFRYQLGRGAVRPLEQPAVVAPRVDVAPDAEPALPVASEPDRFESAVGMTEPAEEYRAPAGADDLQSVLLGELGVSIVAEHAHEPETDGEDA